MNDAGCTIHDTRESISSRIMHHESWIAFNGGDPGYRHSGTGVSPSKGSE